MHALDTVDSNQYPRTNNQQFVVVRSFLHRTVHAISVQNAKKTDVLEQEVFLWLLSMHLDGNVKYIVVLRRFSLLWLIAPCC